MGSLLEIGCKTGALEPMAPDIPTLDSSRISRPSKHTV